MPPKISPKYILNLSKRIAATLRDEYLMDKEIEGYLLRWQETDYNNWESFSLKLNLLKDLDVLGTLLNIDDETLLKIAIDLGIETPDFIPSIPTFRNEIKSNYQNASSTFEKAYKQIEEHPDIAVGLANSALESIIKEIFKDERIKTKPAAGKTLYDLTSELLKEFQMFPNSDLPIEIKTIGSSLLSVNQSIEKLRSEKTNVHGKTTDDYVIQDSLYTYFVVNSVATVGLFLNSYYKLKFPKPKVVTQGNDDLPF